eukprot:6431409-Prymnesium_polylepis.1
MTHDLLAASNSPRGRSTDWRMRDNATMNASTRQERNDTRQQTMAPTEETPTAPAQKQKRTSAKSARRTRTTQQQQEERRQAQQNANRARQPAETTQAIKTPTEETVTN